MSTKTIVVGYDGSDGGKAAAGWALDEAARTGAAVDFVCVLEWPMYPPVTPLAPGPVGLPEPEAEQRAAELLERAREAAARTHPQVRLQTTLLNGGAADQLCDRSRTAAMLVLGSHGHGGWSALLVGSVSLAVTAHAHCPVVVVRGTEAEPHPSRRAIVVGLDGSKSAELALAFAYDQAAERNAPLKVLRAWLPTIPRWDTTEPDLDSLCDAERSAIDEQLTGWRAKHPSVPVYIEVLVEHPGRALVAASETAQLMVVGSRGRGGLSGLLLGSVSQQLLHHARCPVAVVRELAAPGG